MMTDKQIADGAFEKVYNSLSPVERAVIDLKIYYIKREQEGKETKK